VSDLSSAGLFAIAAATSLASSWLLVSRLGRIGARLGLSEALLGMLTALAADAPEITAAVTALGRHDHSVGTGVAIGSNVFNLAALLGLAGVVAGQIALHRRVILLSGVVAVWISAVCLVVVVGVISPAVGLVAVLAALLPYLALLGMGRRRLLRIWLPLAWTRWLATVVHEEELELVVAIHPRRGRAMDAVTAGIAVVVVVVASVAMEHTATRLGAHNAVPGIVVGGLVLAAVTSLPNAVAAVYFAARGRGAAVLSTALNSNAINVVAGFLIPASALGLGSPAGSEKFIAAAYAAMTALALVIAYANRGLRRGPGALIIAAYLAVAVVLLLTA
jgi:cation:H+ antiporter